MSTTMIVACAVAFGVGFGAGNLDAAVRYVPLTVLSGFAGLGVYFLVTVCGVAVSVMPGGAGY